MGVATGNMKATGSRSVCLLYVVTELSDFV